jgi:hypothetical protein
MPTGPKGQKRPADVIGNVVEMKERSAQREGSRQARGAAAGRKVPENW